MTDLASLSKTTRPGLVKFDNLHTRWWNNFMDAVARNPDALNPWESDFIREMRSRRETHTWQPTLKQWNLVKTLSEKCK